MAFLAPYQAIDHSSVRFNFLNEDVTTLCVCVCVCVRQSARMNHCVKQPYGESAGPSLSKVHISSDTLRIHILVVVVRIHILHQILGVAEEAARWAFVRAPPAYPPRPHPDERAGEASS